MDKHLLEVKNIEICYDDTLAVQDVSFSMKEGEILGIVGESGSGKSTLIKAAMGLLGEEAQITQGEILYKGKNILEASSRELRRMHGPQMGMIFQNTGTSLCPIRTIEEQLYESVRQHEKIDKKEIRERALDLFEKMRFQDGMRVLKSYPFELSGGMNQRVGIMMAMILTPRLLFADEPTSALDVTVQAQVVKEMMQMRETYGTGIAIVTHNIGVVERMADFIAVMHKGRLVEYGRKEDVIYHPQEEYTQKLIRAVLRLDRG